MHQKNIICKVCYSWIPRICRLHSPVLCLHCSRISVVAQIFALWPPFWWIFAFERFHTQSEQKNFLFTWILCRFELNQELSKQKISFFRYGNFQNKAVVKQCDLLTFLSSSNLVPFRECLDFISEVRAGEIKMASESPGEIDQKMEKSKYDKHQHNCDRFQCLLNANHPAFQVKLFQKEVKSDRKRTEIDRKRTSKKVLYSSPVWVYIFLLVLKIPEVSGSGLCDPLLCSCSVQTANCSHRGFLSVPAGLNKDIRSLGKYWQL